MNDFIFWATFIVLGAFVFYFDRRYYMLRCPSTAVPRPYSFARVQLGWWMVIVLASFISIILVRKAIPTFDNSTLYLLGIASATTIGATLIDINDQNNASIAGLSQNMQSDNFFLDILSDKNGVNVHRFQTVVFNIVFGVWFIVYVLDHISPNTNTGLNAIIPVITPNNLVLLGVSSGVYAALKMTENQQLTGSPVPASMPPNPAVAAPGAPIAVVSAPVVVVPAGGDGAGSSGGGISGGNVSGGITVNNPVDPNLNAAQADGVHVGNG
jgi:hypothetical protein